MSSESVLGDAGMGSGREKIVFKTAGHHPPSDKSLKSDQSAYTGEFEAHCLRHFAARDEVCGWEEEGHADDAAPEAVSPFHPVDLFEFGERHGGVEELEFGGGAVFGEFGFPVGSAHGRKGTGYWAPFCYAEAGRC